MIVSFVFFYGWKAPRESGGREVYAKMLSGSYHPMKRWLKINSAMVSQGMDEAKESILQLFDPQTRNFLQQSSVLNQLVTADDGAREIANTILTDRQAVKLGVTVSTQEIVDRLRMQPGVTRQAIEFAAQRQGMSVNAWIESLRQREEQRRVMTLVSMTAQTSQFEVWQEYLLGRETMKLKLAAYPIEKFESQVTVTDDDLTSYLTTHAEQFRVPAQRRYAYVRVAKKDFIDQIKPTEEQLAVYREQNQPAYLLPKAVTTQDIQFIPSEDYPTTQAEAIMAQARRCRGAQR